MVLPFFHGSKKVRAFVQDPTAILPPDRVVYRCLITRKTAQPVIPDQFAVVWHRHILPLPVWACEGIGLSRRATAAGLPQARAWGKAARMLLFRLGGRAGPVNACTPPKRVMDRRTPIDGCSPTPQGSEQSFTTPQGGLTGSNRTEPERTGAVWDRRNVVPARTNNPPPPPRNGCIEARACLI